MIKTKLIAIFMLTAILSACTKEQYADMKMNAIAGDWVMCSATVDKNTNLMNPENYPAISPASVIKEGSKWYFVYTLPVIEKGKSVSLYKATHEITWNPLVGNYIFLQPSDAEMDMMHIKRATSSMYYDLRSRTIFFKDSFTTLSVYWGKK